MADTPHLTLPLLAAAQAQKHVTLNEALMALDALVHLAVKERNRNTPPGTPEQGARYLVGTAPTGAFAGHAGEVALFEFGAWRFFTPRRGWHAYLENEDRIAVYDGAVWRDLGHYNRDLTGLQQLGIGTAADAVNRFAAKLNAALFTAQSTSEGGTGDLRLVLNKAGAANVLSLILQSAFGGRAEFGLVGNDDLSVRVSADGALWRDALRVDRTTGLVSFPSGIVSGAESGNLLINAEGAVNQRVFAGGVLAPNVYGFDRWKAGPAGCTLTRAGDGTFTLTGSLVQVVEQPRLAGRTVTFSVEALTGPLDIQVEGVSASIAAGPGRRAVTLTVPTAATGDVTVTLTGSGVSFARPQLNRGSQAAPYAPIPPSLELLMCQRYYAKTFPLGTQPAPGRGFAGAISSTAVVANVIQTVPWHFPVTMRTVPNVTFFAPNGAGASWSSGGVPAVASAGMSTADSIRVGYSGSASIAVGTYTAVHAVADAEF